MSDGDLTPLYLHFNRHGRRVPIVIDWIEGTLNPTKHGSMIDGIMNMNFILDHQIYKMIK